MSSTTELIPLATIVPPENHEVGGGFDAGDSDQARRKVHHTERSRLLSANRQRSQRRPINRGPPLLRPRWSAP